LSETIRGGGHVGANAWFGYHAGWPLASLTVAPDSLTFSMWPIKYKFERSSIRGLLKKPVFGRTSLFIVHTNPAFSKSVIFQPLSFSRLESVLAQNGYVLADDEARFATEAIRYSNRIASIVVIAAVLGLIAAVIAMAVARRA
jgi:hypothetical protein